MLGTASSTLLIRESDLDASRFSSYSFEEFLNSSGASETEDGMFKMIRKDIEGNIGYKENNPDPLPPTLESLLNNLTLDKPILFPTPTQPSHLVGPSTTASRRSNSISWLASAFKFEPTRDTSNACNLITEAGPVESKPIIIYASRMKLIEKLTSVLDYKLMDDVLLTIEMIMHPIDFVACLMSRIAQAFHAVPGWDSREEVDPEVVKMRGLIVLQHWAVNILTSSPDYSIRKIVIDGIDVIWQQSRTLSESDQRFLIKIRRLFDPRGELSITTPPALDDFDEGVSSIYELEGFEIKKEAPEGRKWRDKLKLKLKSIFSNSTTSSSKSVLKRNNSKNSSGFSSPSFLVNSFSSDLECCEDVSSVLIRERSKTLANILAVLEWDLFSEIQRSELVLFPSARESPQRLAEECSNLQRAIEHFNSMCQWFVQIILNQEDEDNSVSLLAKLIRLAVKCLLIHNYNTALQIILALQSPAISAKKELWLCLSGWERRLAKDLAIFGSPVKNFKNVRKALEDVQREQVPAVPFTGLFISDFVFNWERNSGEHCDDLIPVYKNHVAAKIVRQFIAFQGKSHGFGKDLGEKERQLYSYFADIGRLGGEFGM